ncbi:hypothetical protein CEXT_169771 [Caerostris extrusa]|uniref:Uncharacterized protein n=1 Tax=Caerostris extrusa TaxID=172846 RepID=A0AAV4PDN9_CAEEX|nr:hypothetical protein CEXT_169771 [Caerostris extrusa]
MQDHLGCLEREGRKCHKPPRKPRPSPSEKRFFNSRKTDQTLAYTNAMHGKLRTVLPLIQLLPSALLILLVGTLTK